jgi:thiamine biosynthesis lipoprotein
MPAQRIAFHAMACACEVMLEAEDEPSAQALAAVAIAEVQRVQDKYSRYLVGSVLSQINAAAGAEPVACDEETWALLDYAQTLYAASGGLFDITSGVLRRVWDFKAQRLPSPGELAAILPLIGWPRVQRQDRQVRLPVPGMEIDFGGFGKEYAADCAANALAKEGVRHGYVNLGGDLRVVGPRADGTPWMIGILHPRALGELLATIPVSRGGLATSGDYERCFERDGQRHCHILDPRTGQSVNHWRTVSVVAPLAVVAGNCTTIAMLKQGDGLAFLQSTGFSYLAVDHEGAVHTHQDVAAR